MKVLVTGGTGFTGKALVRRLVDGGHEVVALDNKEGLATDELRNMGAEVVIGSVADKAIVEKCMQGVDVVQHLAAAFRELDVPRHYYDEINIEGTRNVLEGAEKQGVSKFIYCSTCGVHGNVDSPPANEDAPINAADYYQQTKYAAEPIVHEFGDRGMKTVVLRPSAIYGPGDPERFFMIFKRVNRGKFPMFGNGKTWYHPLYVENLVDAHMLVMEPGNGDGRTYLIADEEYVTINDLVNRVGKALAVDVKIKYFPLWPLIVAGHIFETVCKPLKITPPIFPRRVDWFRQNRAFDITRAKKELGFVPKVGLDEGLAKTAAWYRSEGYL